MPQVRAKFVCVSIQDYPENEQKNVVFSPVITGSEENKSFSKYTPGGAANLVISYETQAADFFEEGKEYYLDFTKSE
jgi:hypothetical protein